ncbi:hypothetical protein HPB48_008753 [Haemaphysalis longicornis]|uniref:F-box domain-containing protein n=1 Tax=Haemaphysalis longicornis TaxID=44386 RepID=A0A9J6GPJ9_HAELO|nr:hypothetical protein HPB48_008753 [Haemaphysalis longicornis]
MSTACISDLPDVVLEYIFCYLSPYRDFKSCRLVNKAWYAHAKAAERKIRRDFLNSVSLQNVVWCQKPTESRPTISKRYSHSACVLGDSMYVFGGCTTANTTFNDLWRLDLATRRWIRPLTMGTYPPPKACASLVTYKENLLLFGGWTHTSPYPVHQARRSLDPQELFAGTATWRIFRHLHVYNCGANRWTQVSTVGSCPSMAGHSATLQQGHLMVVFGGLHCNNPVGPIASSSNDVWVLDLHSYVWSKQSTTTPKPWPRYGHSQVWLLVGVLSIVGSKHCEIIASLLSGQTLKSGGGWTLLNDVWLLRISDDPEKPWSWKEVTVTNREHGAPQLSFHPACKIGNRVVVLSKSQRAYATPSGLHPVGMLRVRPTHRVWVPPSPEQPARPQPSEGQRDSCVNGTRGVLKRPLESSPPQPSASSASSPLHSQPSASSHSSADFALPSDSIGISFCCRASVRPRRTPAAPRLPKKTALSSSPSARPSVRPNARHNRQRQLELLDRMEQRLKALRAGSNAVPAVRKRPPISICPMRLYVLDVSHVTQDAQAAWMPLQQPPQHAAGGGTVAPSSVVEEVILYSLVLGRGELILFGGIQKDLVNRQEDTDAASEVVSSQLHFITSPRDVI